MSDGKVHLRSVGFLLLLAVFFLIGPGCSNPDKTIERKFEEAQEKLDDDRIEDAVRILEDLDERFPERFDVNEFLAFTYSRNNNPDKAADSFLKAARLAPDREELILYAAQAREEAENFGQAASHYRLYLTDNFNDASGWQALARLEEERGHRNDAIDAYVHAYRARPSAATAAKIGDLFLRLDNIAQAHHWFKTSIDEADEPVPEALLGLLRISMEEENWERAEELVDELDREHEGELDQSDLAMARDELRRWRESIEELEQQRKEQAEEEARRAAEREKQEEERAEEERLAREHAEAEAEAEEARLAELEAEAAEAEEESTEEEEEVESEPDPSEEILAEASRQYENRRYEEAARLYWQALSHDDSRAETWFELSRSLYRAESWNDAELTALEALRRDPDRERYHLHYLNVIQKTHSVRAYLRELERVHNRFPRNPEVALALANTFARGHHAHQQAIRYYQLFLRLAPNDSRRQQVEQSIRRLSDS